MKKIRVVTFHGSHNHGSMLQTYALQTFIKGLSNQIDYKVINYRTSNQKKFYNIYKPSSSLKNIIKNILAFKYESKLKNKYEKYENFLRTYIFLTEEYGEMEDLSKVKIDYLISGSDQLWNVRAKDFDWVYLGEFASEIKKLSYAASLGPLLINWEEYNKSKYETLLNQYQAISVREENSKKMLAETFNHTPEIHIDPTLLISADEWRKLTKGIEVAENEEYIFFYYLETTKEILRMVRKISKQTGLKVVIAKYCGKVDYINSFIKKYDTGPKEFLSLIDNAKFVISSSFHGTVFSIIFNKPFLAVNGMNDNRISNLLTLLQLENKEVNLDNYVDRVNTVYDIDFKYANKQIEIERGRSRKYLERELEL